MPAATPDRSGESHIAAINSSRGDDAHSIVSQNVQKLIEEVLSWQKHNQSHGVPSIPNQHAIPKKSKEFHNVSEERNLGIRFAKVLLRRHKSLGSAPSQLQLSPSEVTLVNSVPGVPNRGCAASALCNSNVAQHNPELPIIRNVHYSIGIHHAADTTVINFEHCEDVLERQQEHIETLKAMLTDMKTRPSDRRIMELAERLKVPELGDRQPLSVNLMLKRVQQRFHDKVCDSQMLTTPAGQPAASKPTVPSLSEPRSSCGVSHLVRTLVEDVLAWQGRNEVQRIPNQHAGSLYDDSEERNLGIRFAKVLLRRDKSLGSAPSQLQLLSSEVALVNSVPGVPLCGCSATASCNINVVQQHPELPIMLKVHDSNGIHHAADTTDINFEHCQDLLERQQEHIETLKSMLTDMKTRPSDSRIMELAECLKVPELGDRQPLPLDLIFKRVQQHFYDEVCEIQSKSRTTCNTKRRPQILGSASNKKARFATAIHGRGASHHAPPSNRSEEGERPSSDLAQCAAAKQLPSHTGRILHLGSSDIEQFTDTRQELRSTLIFMKILEPIWAIDVADGQKMFECVANKARWQNQFKPLASGDIIIICIKGENKVSAVCEVASTATVKETNREVLKSKLQESRHTALDAYLDDAESFDYVEFKQVFDCRSVFSEFNIADSLARVGLARPKVPLVGLLRPDVIDIQWHNRLYELLQQATRRMPVSLGA